MRVRMWLLAGCWGLAALAAPAEEIEVHATPVALDARDPRAPRVGRLVYRGGLRLTSPSERFGGLSALHVSPDGSELVAVTDEGCWLRARLAYDSEGRLTGVARAVLGPLRDPRGEALRGKVMQDAEGLARLPDGSWVVSFERQQRLWRYPAGPAPEGPAEPLDVPRELWRAPENGGVEALTALPDGRLVALTEDLTVRGGLRGFVRERRGWRALLYPVDGSPRPSDATVLPSGDLLVLERSYAPESGVTARLRRVPGDRVRKNGRLAGEVLAQFRAPLTVDNFEGVAARLGAHGETLVYLLSDDKFSATQRTLLMLFALERTEIPR